MPRPSFLLIAVAAACSFPAASAAQNPSLSARSITVLESECADGQSASCDELSFRFAYGLRGVAQDHGRSAHFKLRSCEAGNARACGVYASRVRLSHPGYPRDNPAVVADYARRGCLGNDGPTCSFATSIAIKSANYSPQQRVEIFRKVCRIGEANDCERAAYAEGERRNWKEAAELARQACARGMQNSCQNHRAYLARYLNSQRALAPANTRTTPPAARQAPTKVSTEITPDMYQPDRGRRSNARDNSRSGNESCTKSNGSPGKRYWYYGFDNKRNTGPCT